METPNNTTVTSLQPTEQPLESASPLFLEKKVSGLFELAKKIIPHAPDSTTSPLVSEFRNLYQNLNFYFSLQIETLLCLELSIDLKEPDALQERIHLLHFIFDKILPLLEQSLNYKSLQDRVTSALSASMQAYCALPCDQIEKSNVDLYEEIQFRLDFPAFYFKTIDFLNILENIKSNIKEDKDTTKYTIKRFSENLKFLLEKTQNIKLPINTLDEDLTKHIDKVFFIIGFLQHCQKKSEATLLLPDIANLIATLSLKLMAKENAYEIKRFGGKLSFLAEQTLKTDQDIEKIDEGVFKSEDVLFLGENVLSETVNLLFNSDIDSISQNKRLMALLSNDDICSQVTQVVAGRIAKEMANWPTIEKKLASVTPEQLMQYQKTIDLALYLSNTVLANRSKLHTDRLHLIAQLYAQANHFFLAANHYFKHIDDYTGQDEQLFNTLHGYYIALEKLLPDLNLYIEDKIKLSKDKSKSQDAIKFQKHQLYTACHSVLHYKICFIFVCAFLSKYDLAQRAHQKAQVALFETQGKLDSEQIKEHKDLILHAKLKLQEADRILQEYNRLKASLSKPGKNIVFYSYRNSLVQAVDINDLFNAIASNTKMVVPNKNSPAYEKLNNVYFNEFNSFPVRVALLTHINKIFEVDYLAKVETPPISPQEKMLRVAQLQENINVLSACINTVVKLHIERSPQATDSKLLSQRLINNILLQATEIETLLMTQQVPKGQYSLLYHQVHANFQIFLAHVADYVNEALKDADNGALKLKAVFELFAAYMAIFHQFANCELIQIAQSKALALLKEVEASHILKPEELSEIYKYLNDAEDDDPFLFFLHDTFNTLSDKAIDIEKFLTARTSKSLKIASTKLGQALFEKLNSQLQSKNPDILELANWLLTLNQELGLNDTLLLLERFNEHFKSKMKFYEGENIGMMQVLSETTNCIVKAIDNTVMQLQQKAKESEEKQEKLKQKQAIEHGQKRIKEQMRIIQQQQKTLNKKSRQEQSEKETLPSTQDHNEPKDKPEGAKPQQRLKKQKEPLLVEENEWLKDLLKKEKAPSSKQLRLQQRQQEKEQQRQARIFEKKQEKTLRMQAQREQDELEQQLKMAANEEKKLKQAEEKQALLKQQQKLAKQRDAQISNIAEDILAEVINDLASMILQEDDLSQLLTQLSRLRVESNAHKVALQIALEPKMREILEAFHQQGIRAYLYGGYPRDKLLGREPRDGDIVVFGSMQDVQKLLGPDCIINQNSPEKQLIYQGLDIRCEDEYLSLSAFANQLDFTINAFLVDYQGNVFAPIASSMVDLHEKALQTILDPANSFAADSRRMYRFITQSFSLFDKEPSQYQEALVQNASKLSQLPFSAYRKNVLALFLRGHAQNTLNYILKINLLSSIFLPLGQVDLGKDELSWFENACHHIDMAFPLTVKKDYPFNRLICIFLAPVIKKKMNTQHQLGLQENIDQTIDEMFLAFNDYKLNAADRKIFAIHLRENYFQFINYIHQQSIQTKHQMPHPTFLVQFNHFKAPESEAGDLPLSNANQRKNKKKH